MSHSPHNQDKSSDGQRLAKVIARSGLCSRREAEVWITNGRVKVDGKLVQTPAFNVTLKSEIIVDDQPLQQPQETRLWLYHKKRGFVVSAKDEADRETIYDQLPKGLPRMMPVGRLDINTEGLLLMTNDGELKRELELPANGWKRWYRVRAFGNLDPAHLKELEKGITIDGMTYGAIETVFERQQGANMWLKMGLSEGKNREIKKVLGFMGLKVNRLIRLSFGPFNLGQLPLGDIIEVQPDVLDRQLRRQRGTQNDEKPARKRTRSSTKKGARPSGKGQENKPRALKQKGKPQPGKGKPARKSGRT